MNPLLVSLTGVLLLPLFLGKWRVSILGLGAQGVLMAWIAYRMHPSMRHASEWLSLIDLGVLRGVLVPALLYQTLARERTSARSDVIPPNLLSWTVALGVVLVSYNFAGSLLPEAGDPQMVVAVGVTALLLGFLILASQSGHISQIVGALRIQNAIAILELGPDHSHASVALQVGQIAIELGTVLLFRGYLSSLAPARDAHESTGGHTL